MENSEFKPVKLRLKIDLVSYPVREQEWVNIVNHNQVQVLSIPVLLLTFNQDWTCNLLMIVSFEA